MAKRRAPVRSTSSGVSSSERRSSKRLKLSADSALNNAKVNANSTGIKSECTADSIRISPAAETPALAEKRKVSTNGSNGKHKKLSSLKISEEVATHSTQTSKKDLQKAPGKYDKSTTGVIASSPVATNALEEREGTKLLTDNGASLDPEADDETDFNDHDNDQVYHRPPPVNSSVLPLPWKGRLGYACLNTYLRTASTPIFSSRTCRLASIIENRHPLMFPDQPPHPTKNRPDKTQPASVERGQRFVESLGLANARDCIKMIKWNHRYGIKFLRLSSEMFPFASHEEYGYRLAPFASEVLAEVGKTAAEFGHRLTTHPGQFTQLGSPRAVVNKNAVRDLLYHAEMLSLLKLPTQQDRDAVMILHLGGMFGDKAATLDRFRENYIKLPESVKKRLVLENDDVGWSVHDLLPLCEELNIPMVLDFHHHNIIFNSGQIREGSQDIVALFPRILQTWKRKEITPKMHYSEPTPAAITPKQRRKHSARVATLPPCPDNMDLMIEAKDKEQAVFELMRNFKLPGFDRINDIKPHVRDDENRDLKTKMAKKRGDQDLKMDNQVLIPDEEIAMGGPEGRVYWPPGMEEWLQRKKRSSKKKGDDPKVPSSRKLKKVSSPVEDGS